MLKKGLKKLNLFYPQWQGSGPDPAVYHGGLELKNYFSPALNFAEIKVSLSPAAPVKNAIFAYADLLRQMQETASLLGELWPQTIFTLGGGCDAGIIPVAWLNAYYAGELTVIWFDAHGDLNTPVSSPSGYFYGMPVRHLLGEGDKKIINLLPALLEPAQLVMAGLRELDPAEAAFIEKAALKVLTVAELEAGPQCLLQAVKDARPGFGAVNAPQNIYIHLDLDVLDPALFPHAPVPAAGGLKPQTLLSLIEHLETEFNLVGLGLFEYSPTGSAPAKFLEEIVKIGTA